jgi:hypothetical protein
MIKCIGDKYSKDFIPYRKFQYDFEISPEFAQDITALGLNWRPELVEILTSDFKMLLEEFPFFTTKLRTLKDFL